MSTPDGFSSPNRKGRMNRSRMIAAGTSVGALIAITAGVAAANPAPSTKTKANLSPRTAPSGQSNQGSANGSDSQGQVGDQGQGGDDQWRQLPPDPSASDPGLSGGTDNGSSDFGQPQPFDPGQSSGSSNTSSGGS